ncbi:MAG TPA: hypothetical protein V6D02_05090 [Candidatus Obscuribacterales bacterium]
MSQQDNFGSGFLLGTLFGGVIGGVVGAVVAARVVRQGDKASLDSAEVGEAALGPSDEDMELARRGLEDKIAQLNTAIDDVRQRLGGNGYAQTPEDGGNDY